MFEDFANLMPLWAFLAAIGVTLFAGVVKGAIGFGVPLIITSGLSLFLDPLIAVAGVVFPALVSNFLQVARHPLAEIIDAVKEHRRYILTVCVLILIVTQFVVLLPERVFYLILGVPVVALSVVQLAGVRFTIPEARRRVAEWVIGAMTGVLGGFTGSWGPLTVLYLLALETPKMRQLLVQGVVYSLGATALLAGHLQSGVLNAATTPFSMLLLVPVFVGMLAGFKVGEKLDPELFRKLTLTLLVIAGANLVRRGLIG
ncbi:sulfite exporter TauE/SafE family protein [Gymnodinialimonas ceratoperidinii]|uniref:Probable membrane transporter protein n=1 Tax=Gymnodinialimonas ceratoperidinii TaxID=2856823 RepID=A0A8F6TWF6_9RHOB|nr:sulfite exporter TauE/SafE family protein [Gymnodinialimonas ceratoperidinii]QXT39703.1 sulfite exporter TauE/SafE family protein [Gymnodinialimonas ceratoperidinii]